LIFSKTEKQGRILQVILQKAGDAQNRPCLDLIFCAGDNREFFQVAYEAGYLLGIRSGRQSYGYTVEFVDIE